MAVTTVWAVALIVFIANLLVGSEQPVVHAILQGVASYANWGLIVSTPLLPLAWWWEVRRLRAERAAGKTLAELHALSPEGFESWVGARFRDLGYAVTETGGQADHGVDLVVIRGEEKAVVQCKRYRVRSVGEPAFRDLYGAMQHFEATSAYLVTTGAVTTAATTWAMGKPITIWDGQYLVRLSMGTAPDAGKPTAIDAAPVTATTVASATEQTEALALQDAPSAQTALCPRCGGVLVQRHNRSTGDAFRGCSNFPKCRYTERVASATG